MFSVCVFHVSLLSPAEVRVGQVVGRGVAVGLGTGGMGFGRCL